MLHNSVIFLTPSSSRALIISVAISSLPLAFHHFISLITLSIFDFRTVQPFWLLTSGGSPLSSRYSSVTCSTHLLITSFESNNIFPFLSRMQFVPDLERFLVDIYFTLACISLVFCFRSNSSIYLHFSFYHASFRSLHICRISLCLSLYTFLFLCVSSSLAFFFEEFRWSSRIFVLLYLSLGELSLQLTPYLFSVTAIYGLPLSLIDLILELFLLC